MTEKEYTPIIIVDLAKDRIRIHRSTINALQNPTHIMLIVNPIDRTIGIMHGKDGDLGVHKLKALGETATNCTAGLSHRSSVKFVPNGLILESIKW